MSDATFTPGYKFNINICIIKDCKNKNKQCDTCIRYSNYIPIEVDINDLPKL